MFEEELQRVVALAMFVPVVLGLAESVSIQSVSLGLQILHGQPPSLATFGKKLKRELFTGVLLGLFMRALVAIVAVMLRPAQRYGWPCVCWRASRGAWRRPR